MPSTPQIAAVRRKLRLLQNKLQQETDCTVNIKVGLKRKPNPPGPAENPPKKRRKTLSWMVRAGKRRVHRRVCVAERVKQENVAETQLLTIAQEPHMEGSQEEVSTLSPQKNYKESHTNQTRVGLFL